jgi:ComEC/Rec2-related protein
VFTKKYVIQIFKFIYNRFIALGRYIKDTPILSISLFSIFGTFLSIEIYESSIILKNFRIFLTFLLSIALLSIIFALLLSKDFSQTREDSAGNVKEVVQILFLALLVGFRLSASFLEDYRIVENIGGFTGDFEQKSIRILDISRSRGDIQEITFEIDGVVGLGRVDWFESLTIGGVCNIFAKIERPENFDDFNYVRYLKNKNIYLRSTNIEIISCNNGNPIRNMSDIFLFIKRKLRELREMLSRRVELYLPEPQASLLIGILFGSERAFSNKFEEILRISGTTHIIAASGYNITILILASSKIFSFIKKKHRLILSLLLIWAYCILSGLGASILRATMMGTITIFALLSGNVRNTHLLIPSGTLFLILINPRILFDIGFQLSILATLGLIYLLPSIEEFLKRVFCIKNVPQFLEENLLGTISCTLSTLPISISIFGKVSLVSVFANVLVLPLTESTMLYGTLAVLISFLPNSLAKLAFSLPYIQLKIFEKVVEFFGSIEWGYVDIEKGWIGCLIACFLFIFCIYFYPLDQESYYVKRFKDI